MEKLNDAYYSGITSMFTTGLNVFKNVPADTHGILAMFFICFMIFIVFRLHEYIGVLGTFVLWIFYTFSVFFVGYYAIQYIHFLSAKFNPPPEELPDITETMEERPADPIGIQPPENFWTDVTEHIQFAPIIGDEIHHPRGFPIRRMY